MEAKRRGQALDMDFFSVMDHVEEQKETLWTTWTASDRQDFESVIRMAIQDVESLKNCYPELNVSVPYVLGKLDGYTELFERLYREEQRVYTVTEELAAQTPKARQILLRLYEHDGLRHGDLAAAVGSSYSSLTNIMKKVLLSGAVEAVRSGRNTCYHLTEAGRQYCDYCLRSDNDFTRMIREIALKAAREVAQMRLEVPEGSGLPTRRLQAGDRVTPIIGNEIQDTVTIDSIVELGNQKFAECSRCMENAEEDDPVLLVGWPFGIRYRC